MKDGGAEFVVLGSGCFTPGRPLDGPVRNPAGYALRLGAEVLLFDLGFGNLRQLVRAGLSPDSVSHAFFSHRHPDHLGDLAALLFYYRYDGKPYRRRLRLYGPRGFASFMRRLTAAHHPWLRPRGFALTVAELEEAAVVRGAGWRVHCREVPHSTEALAFRVESPRGSVCYSGDMQHDPGIAAFAADADLFVLECTQPPRARAGGHLRVPEALELARLSRARKVLFTHLSPASAAALAPRIAREPRFALAEDLLRVPLRRR